MDIDKDTELNNETVTEIESEEDAVNNINLDEELPEQNEVQTSRGLKVFIVDDDDFLLEMYAKKFKNSGFEIITASGGEDALSKLKTGDTPDIFIFDMVMPQMDGLELIKTIHDENLIPSATKIVLSNQGQQTDIQKAEEIGVDGYIVKALHAPSEIVEMVINTHNEKNK